MKNIIYFLMLFFMVANSQHVFAGNNGQAERIKAVKQKMKQAWEKESKAPSTRVKFDDSDIDDMELYLSINNNVSIKNIEEFWYASYATKKVSKRLHDKYGYLDRTKRSQRDKGLLKIMEKTWKIKTHNPYHACAYDENELTSIKKKVSKYYDKIQKVKKSNIEFINTIEYSELRENIYRTCRFKRTNLMLDIYRSRSGGGKENKDRAKFKRKANEVMLQMIKDDQVEFNYMYIAPSKLNTSFILDFERFIYAMDTSYDESILSRDEIIMFAESLLTKHQEIFDLNNSRYKIPDVFQSPPDDEALDGYDDPADDVAMVLAHLYAMLEHHNLDGLKSRIFQRFFTHKRIRAEVMGREELKEFRVLYDKKN